MHVALYTIGMDVILKPHTERHVEIEKSNHNHTRTQRERQRRRRGHERGGGGGGPYVGGRHSYWAIQRSWFAGVNAICNLSRKKSREVADF